MKKLTIAIPTYNGSRTIKTTLESIFNQQFPSDDVEVIICENASTDNTLEIIKPFLSKLTLYKNDVNIGGDKNFEMCVNKSQSEYVWILGDDDCLKYGAISYVIDKIKLKDYGCLFVNFSLYDVKQKKEVQKKFLPLKEDIIVKGVTDFLKNTNVAANFLSSVIHNKKNFESVDTTKFYGTSFLQFGVLLDYIENNETLLIAEPLVVNMGDSSDREFNAGGVSVKILNNLYAIVKNAKTKFLEESERKKIQSLIQKMLKYRILSAKRLGLKVDKKLLSDLTTNFKSYPGFWLIDLPLLTTPNFLINILYKIYRVPGINSFFVKYIYNISK